MCSPGVLLKWWWLCTVLACKIRMWLAASCKVADRISLPFGSQWHGTRHLPKEGSTCLYSEPGWPSAALLTCANITDITCGHLGVPFASDWLADGWEITIGLAARRMPIFNTTGCLRVTDCLRHAACLKTFACYGRQYTAKPPVFYKHAESTVMDYNYMSKAPGKKYDILRARCTYI